MTADLDQKGALNKEEFVRLMCFEKKICLEDAFKAADKDGKGWLEEGEVKNALKAAGYDITCTVTELIDNAREEGEGDRKINYNEFILNL